MKKSVESARARRERVVKRMRNTKTNQTMTKQQKQDRLDMIANIVRDILGEDALTQEHTTEEL